MRVATWCIDGVRGRMEVLCHWLERRRPDVVALQKIRVSEEKFPKGELLGAGYRSEPLRRESPYGIPLLSRADGPALEVLDRGLADDDGRDDGLMTARVGDLLVCCVYAPYGNPNKRGIDGALAYKIAQAMAEHSPAPSHPGAASTANSSSSSMDVRSTSITMPLSNAAS